MTFLDVFLGGDIAFKEKIGCIEIGNNVFVGSNTTVLYDVKVGSNVVIGAGSLVNRDIPDNSVAVGVPAKVIGTFDDFIEKRRKDFTYPDGLKPIRHTISDGFEKWCWNDFKERRDKNKKRS